MVTEEPRSEELQERLRAKAKSEIVLPLLRAEAVDAVSREVQVPAHERAR
jgi:hypothetical protein